MLVRTQILLPENLLQELRLLSARSGISVSKTIRTMIEEKITLPKPKINGATAMLKLAEWTKKHHFKGPKDLSTNDTYLYGPIHRSH